MLKIEDLKEGEIYLYDYNWLSKFPKDGALNINTRDWREEKKWWRILNIKPATPEQKHWFKECEKANKFIPYEEAMKTFKKENESLVGRYVKCIKSGSGLNIGNHFKIINWRQGLFDKGFSFHGFQNEFYNYFELMPEGWTSEQENNMFKKGDYIVTLDVESGGWNCARNNYCFKQKINDKGIYPEIDLQGSKFNGNGAMSFDKLNKLKDWRYATPEEIAEYDKLGKPYDVTTLQKKQHKYEVVHCKTQEEWDFVISKLKNSPGSHGFKNLDTDNDKGNCIHFVDDKSLGFCWKNYYLINKGYKIYSFEEWCEKFGHKPDFMNKQEEWIPKVGDWVVYIGNNRDSSEAIKGKAYKLKKVGVYFPELEGLSEAQDEVLLSNLRKALPHEIPQESSNSIPEYVEITEDLFSNCGEKYKKGKIYKAYYYSDDFQGFIWMKDGKEIKDAYSKKYFKPSTKSEYLKQQYPLTTEQCISNNDIIEVGDEVEIIKNGDGNFSSNFTGYRFIVKEIYKGLNIYLREFKGESTGIDISYCKLIKKASQTTNYIHEKQVDSVSPQVNTDLILFKKAKKAKEIDILPVQSPIFVNQKVNNKKQLLILN